MKKVEKTKWMDLLAAGCPSRTYLYLASIFVDWNEFYKLSLWALGPLSLLWLCWDWCLSLALSIMQSQGDAISHRVPKIRNILVIYLFKDICLSVVFLGVGFLWAKSPVFICIFHWKWAYLLRPLFSFQRGRWFSLEVIIMTAPCTNTASADWRYSLLLLLCHSDIHLIAFLFWEPIQFWSLKSLILLAVPVLLLG